MNKQKARTRRGLKAKAILRRSSRPRLVVYRSSLHIYAQIVAQGERGDTVIVSSSTLDKELKSVLTGINKIEQAVQVGKLLAARARKKEIVDVSFDRAGYKYHGRVKALACAAREEGLNF